MEADFRKVTTSRKRRGRPFAGVPPVTVLCAVCQKPKIIPYAWFKRVKRPTCSRQCNGKLRGEALLPHSHKGRAGWTAQSRESCQRKMTGDRNPAWKGGVT